MKNQYLLLLWLLASVLTVEAMPNHPFLITENYQVQLNQLENESEKNDDHSLFQRALLYTYLGKYDTAKVIYEELHQKNRSIETQQLSMLIAIHSEQFSEADSLAKTLAAQKMNAEQRAIYQEHLGILRHKQQRLEQADSLLRTAIHLYEQLYNNDLANAHARLYLSANNLTRGFVSRADSTLQRVATTFQQHLPKNHCLNAILLNYRGYLAYDINRYEQAKTLFARSMKMWEQLELPNHPEAILTQVHYGMLLTEMEYFALAEKELTAALEKVDNSYPLSEIHAWSLFNQALLHEQGQKEYHLALEEMEQAADIFRKKKQFLNLAAAMRMIAIFDDVIGAKLMDKLPDSATVWFNQAGRNYETAERLLMDNKYQQTPIAFLIYEDYGVFLSNEDRIEEAEELLLQAYQLAQRLEQYGNFYLADILTELGKFYLWQKKFKETVYYYDHLIGLEKKADNVRNEDWINTLFGVANLHRELGDYQQAWEYYKIAVPLKLEHIEQLFAVQSRTTRKNLENDRIYSHIFQFLSFTGTENAPVAADDLAQDVLLRIKNLSFDYDVKINNYYKTSNDKEAYQKLQAINEKLFKLWQMSQRELAKEEVSIAELEREKDYLESRVGHLVQQNQREGKRLVTAESIRQRLKEDEVTIDFFFTREYEGSDWTDSIYYFAVVNRSTWDGAKVINLTEKHNLKELLRATDNEEADVWHRYNTFSEVGYDLYQLLWQPLEKHLAGVTKVYCSTTNLLQRISFAGLATDKFGQHHLSDQYTFTYCSDFRNWYSEEKKEYAKTIALFGNPQYTTDSTQDLTSLKYFFPPSKTTKYTVFADDISFRAPVLYLAPLASAAKEVSYIDSLLQNDMWNSQVFTQHAAQEQVFRTMAAISPTVIHIATHGFYFRSDNTYAVKDCPFLQSENAMNKIGIALAGANNSLADCQNIADPASDGILTALEISQLNLQSTKLVILSACESAEGKIDMTEAVHGFYRAFRLAGVDQTILGLWNLPDAATAKLLKHFYDYFHLNRDAALSLQLAQQDIKAIPEYADPIFWAGLVLID